MKHLQHVLWFKGTFLTPQHLQIQDRYMENLLHFQLQSFAFHLWGFSRLQIDLDKLVEGLFGIVEAQGIFPDGLLFDIPEADATPPARTIKEFFDPEHNQRAIYLSVPSQRDDGMNVGLKQDTKTRFVAEVQMVRDENSGLTDKPVQIARKNLKLLIEGENQEGSTVMQVAQVEKTSAGTYQLVPGFVPPMIDIHGSDLLRGIVRGLVEVLAARSSALSEMRRQKNQNRAEFTSSDVANFWLLYTVNHHLPGFQHLLNRRIVHPEQLFMAMLSLAGALITFSNVVVPRDLPEYEHAQLGPCCVELERKIRFLLETVIATNFVALPLQRVRPYMYAVAIDDDRYLSDSRLFLAVSADVTDAELVKRAPSVMRAGAADQVEKMIQRALPGLKLTYVPKPPPEIPVKLKYRYFSMDTTGDVWEGVRRARNLGVYVPADLPNPRLELIVLLPHNG
jgi:type VI secretion system protein ImpJ